jgi:hypothetical protein
LPRPAIEPTALIEVDATDGSGGYRVCLDEDADNACDSDAILQTVRFGEDSNAGVVLTGATVNILGFDRRGLPVTTGGEFTLENVRGTVTRTVTFTAAGDVEVE